MTMEIARILPLNRGLLPHSKKEGCRGLRIEKRNNELGATERLKAICY